MEPDSNSLGEKLKRRRAELNLTEEEVAQRLAVSLRILTLWETNTIYPRWAYHTRLSEFLGFNPFDDSLHENPESNEPHDVANLRSDDNQSLGARLREWRKRMKLNRCALSRLLGTNRTTLLRWENGNCQPRKKVMKILTELGFEVGQTDSMPAIPLNQ